MPTNIALPRKILTLLAGSMVAPCTFIIIFGLDRGEVFPAIKIGFKPIREL